MKKIHTIIGVMSGTSLDGLDVACCTFEKKADGNWSYDIIAAECYDYNADYWLDFDINWKFGKTWKQKLNGAQNLNGLDLMILHKYYGVFIGDCINDLISKHNLKPDLIASHGHTLFHFPGGIPLSFQIGEGAAIYARTDIPVVCDFRSLDICYGGEGAPLVPIGDSLLFSEYDYCLNLGGIANISYEMDHHRIGFDICGCNILTNAIVNEIGLEYDDNGQLADMGLIDDGLLDALNSWGYYKMPPPKSLDKATMLSELMPVINSCSISIEDKLATVNEHIATQILKILDKQSGSLFITGGGAFNKTLIEKIKQGTKINLVLPSVGLIQYKEALVFAFLGLLRILNENNTLAYVTGADRDSIGGALYGRNPNF